jgi:molybdenum cofactor cytidylyltransferase
MTITPTNSLAGAENFRAFAIVPAAGRSSRMGRAKLLATWRAKPLVAWTIAAWQQSGVSAIVMTVHPDDAALAELARGLGVAVVVPAAPPAEMKDSVQLALDHAREKFAPSEHDVWLLAPADMPELSPDVCRQLLAAARENSGRIIVPQHAGRRGHPVLFPWPVAAEVATLGASEGVNALFARHKVQLLDCGPACLADDIDTPADLARLQDR